MREIDEGKIVGALLIDLSKAFDSVPHDQLLSELMNIGCGNNVLRWFHSYLSNRVQRVYERPDSTEWKMVSRGVPQGSGLSPLLFNIFVRDIPKLNDSDTRQYADDITHSDYGKTEHEVVGKLEKAFEATKQFCDNKGLVINTEKTQFILMYAPGERIDNNIEILLGNVGVKPVKTVKLLGMTLDRYLSFGPHIDLMISKTNGLLGMLARTAAMLPTSILRTVYISLIRSHLESCSGVWASAASSHLHKLDIIQKRAARIILQKPRNTHAAPLQQILNLETLTTRRHRHIKHIVQQCLNNTYNPALDELFSWNANESCMSYNNKYRINIGRRRFENYAGELIKDGI